MGKYWGQLPCRFFFFSSVGRDVPSFILCCIAAAASFCLTWHEKGRGTASRIKPNYILLYDIASIIHVYLNLRSRMQDLRM